MISIMYNFKKFEETNQRVESRITVTAHNSIGFPTKFYQDNHIDSYDHVVLYYDVEQKAIGIRFTSDPAEPHKFKLIKSSQGYGASIVATSFFKLNGIDAKTYKNRYDWKKIPQEGIGELFVIELKAKELEAQA